MSRVKASLRARALTAFVGRSALDPAAGRTGRDHAVVVDGIENLDAYLSGYLPQIGVTVAVVATVGGMMTVIDPATGGVAVATTLVVPVLPRLWDRALAARGADHWDAYEDLHAEFVDSMQGMTTLVAFGADGRREAQLARASRRLLERTMGPVARRLPRHLLGAARHGSSRSGPPGGRGCPPLRRGSRGRPIPGRRGAG